MAKPTTPTHDVVVYGPENDAGKAYGTRVGAAWPTKGGGYSVKIADGISVSGRFFLLEKKSNNNDNDNTRRGDDTPF